MEDKIIDDLDVDFMREILGPADLQIGDNLVRDIMTEYNNTCNVDGLSQWNATSAPALHLQAAAMSSGGQQEAFFIQAGGQIHHQNQFFTDNSNNNNNSMNHHHHSQIAVNSLPHGATITNTSGGYVMQPVEFNPQSTSYTTLDFSIQPGAQMMLANNHHQILPSNSPPVLQPMQQQQQQQSYNNVVNPGTFQSNTSMILTPPQPSAAIQFDHTPASNNRRVRKNLKDILKEKDSGLNTNTMMLNQQDQNMFTPHHIQPHQIIVHPQSQPQHFNQGQVIDPNMNSDLYRMVTNSAPTNSIKLMMPSSGTPPLATVQKVPNSPPSLASLSSSTMMANDTKQSPSFVIPAATVSTLAEKQVGVKQNKHKSENSKIKTKSSSSKENISLSSSSGPPLTAKRNKVSKRTSHNAIEKKYRSSINDKINELKNRVAGPNIKLQKSGILRKALEHLNMVDDTIKNLNTENSSYRSAMNAIRLQLNSAQTETLILQNIQNIVNSIPAEFHTRQYPNVLTPPGSSSPMASMSDYSQFSSGENSNSSSSDSFSSSGSPSRESPSSLDSGLSASRIPPFKKMKKEPMSDASRVFLCMFVMSVLFFNPFNLIFNSPTSSSGSVHSNGQYMESGQHLNSRVLNWFRTNSESIDNATMSNNLASAGSSYFTTQAIISWSLNFILVIFCLLRLYLKSEPVIERDLSIEKIWLVYQKASKSFQRRMYDESFGWLEKGLNELGHSVPRTKWQLMFGIVWQLTRVALNSFFTRLATMSIWWTKSSKNNEEKRRQMFKVYKLSALFYYEASKFGYLNMHSEKDFTPRTTLDEVDNKAECKSDNGRSANTNLRLTITPYSYLMSIYFMLANYNMCEIYTLEHHKPDMTVRDEYNLCEYYMGTSLYLSLFLPSRLSRSIIKYMMKKKLSPKLKKFDNDEDDTAVDNEKQACKWRKLRALLRKSLFLNYLINFDIYSNLNNKSDQSEQDRLKVLNLLSFKRRVFKSTESFLYSADDSASYLDATSSSTVRGDYGVAISFVVGKFQDFLLYKMTGHILAAQSQMIRSERILKRRGHGKPLIDAVDAVTSNQASINNSHRRRKLDDLDEQQKEQADVDQIKFERVMNLYKKNFDSSAVSPQQETHLLLVEFLAMLNNWKLRNFDARTSGYIREKLFEKKTENSSPFVEAIRSVLRAHECIASGRPSEESLKYCRDAVNSLKAFDHSFNAYSPNYYLIEKFELLIYDWILSAQTHVWTEQKKFELELYNECLSKYQDLVVNLFPNLSSKVKMYQTVMLCLTNRNPISLLNATSKQSTFAKCNQEALFSINNILKNFHLHLVE